MNIINNNMYYSHKRKDLTLKDKERFNTHMIPVQPKATIVK